jgi:CRISPR-associated protein Csb2
MGREGFVAPPAVTAYRKCEYRRATEPTRRPISAFNILKPDGSAFRAFDAIRKGLTVAGMIRGAAKQAAARSGWPESKIASFILGHPASAERFAYIPIPSIEVRGDVSALRIGAVRRVLLTSFSGAFTEEFAWARRNLSGQELFAEGAAEPVAMLALIPANDAMVQRYVRPAAEWATVTPVVLPGFDDPAHLRRRLEKKCESSEQKSLLERLAGRIDGLLRKAIVQAGFSEELARHAELEWRKCGFLAGVEMADSYGVPDHLRRFPRYHVRIRWLDGAGAPVAVPGPVCIGGGRFYGIGLFAGVM